MTGVLHLHKVWLNHEICFLYIHLEFQDHINNSCNFISYDDLWLRYYEQNGCTNTFSYGERDLTEIMNVNKYQMYVNDYTFNADGEPAMRTLSNLAHHSSPQCTVIVTSQTVFSTISQLICFVFGPEI